MLLISFLHKEPAKFFQHIFSCSKLAAEFLLVKGLCRHHFLDVAFHKEDT